MAQQWISAKVRLRCFLPVDCSQVFLRTAIWSHPQAFHYKERSEPSLLIVQRKEKATKEMQDSAEGGRKIYTYFQKLATAGGGQTERTAWLSNDQRRNLEREAAMKTLDKKSITSPRLSTNRA